MSWTYNDLPHQRTLATCTNQSKQFWDKWLKNGSSCNNVGLKENVDLKSHTFFTKLATTHHYFSGHVIPFHTAALHINIKIKYYCNNTFSQRCSTTDSHIASIKDTRGTFIFFLFGINSFSHTGGILFKIRFFFLTMLSQLSNLESHIDIDWNFDQKQNHIRINLFVEFYFIYYFMELKIKCLQKYLKGYLLFRHGSEFYFLSTKPFLLSVGLTKLLRFWTQTNGVNSGGIMKRMVMILMGVMMMYKNYLYSNNTISVCLSHEKWIKKFGASY